MLLCLLVGSSAAAQQTRIPVRDLGPVVASTGAPLGSLLNVMQRSDGRVFVNDGQNRRIHLFDSTLKSSTIIADTAAGAPIAYDRVPVPFIPFPGDSILFPDRVSGTLLVVHADGKGARAIALPKASDLRWLRSGTSGFDASGGLVYRGLKPTPPWRVGDPNTPVDSAPLVRANLDTRSTDTIAMLKTATGYLVRAVRGGDGKYRAMETLVPVTIVDAWAIHADGSLAILRGLDYHIDWINVDGTRSSSPKLPFDWRPLTEADKLAMIDSVKKAWKPYDLYASEANAILLSQGAPQDQWATTTLPDGTKGVPVEMRVIPPEEMPDYVPSIRSGAMQADRDGNLWILPNTSAQSRKGGLVYDIVNRRGELTERVEVPVGRSVVGFGKGGSVFLMSGDRTKGFTLERARFK